MPRKFTLEYWLVDGSYQGKLRELPNITGQGDTLEELEENIRDVCQVLMGDEEDSPSDVQTKEIEIDI